MRPFSVRFRDGTTRWVRHRDPRGECLVGGMNWPMCALGVQVHLECVEPAFPEAAARWAEQSDARASKRSAIGVAESPAHSDELGTP